MADQSLLARNDESNQQSTRNGAQGLFAAGGLLGALLASSCCIVPLALVTLGISGTWIGSLTDLEPYKPYFAAISLVFLGLGHWHVYYKPKPACAADSYCARPASGRLTKLALWSATLLVLASMSINLWAPWFY